MQMFQIEMKNPWKENIEYPQEPLYNFKMIQLKFKKSFYGIKGSHTDRTRMIIEELDTECKDWMEDYLKIENGLIEFTIPKTGKYEIIQQSRSSNADRSNRIGPAMGVTVSLELDLKMVRKPRL